LKQQIQQVLEAREAFEQQCTRLRPDLHRFCARMTGSLSDGEDLVQEVLVHAFYRLPELRDGASLRAWLFRMAHNRCVDLLRTRRATLPIDDDALTFDAETASLEAQELAQNVLVTIFTQLPPRERAAVVLKDVLGYSLEEAAEITGSNVGAIKASVHRARQKLARVSQAARPPILTEEHRDVIERYIQRFNARDWAGVRALLAEGARLEVVEHLQGSFDGRYFHNYAALAEDFRLAWVELEGEPAIVQYRKFEDTWRPFSLLLLFVSEGRVSRVRDYVHVEYLLREARVNELAPA
jgi:RNA polymerase sigma-70 factor (ECF subfamily)